MPKSDGLEKHLREKWGVAATVTPARSAAHGPTGPIIRHIEIERAHDGDVDHFHFYAVAGGRRQRRKSFTAWIAAQDEAYRLARSGMVVRWIRTPA